MRRRKVNVGAQEEVVSALWEFAAAIEKRSLGERNDRNVDLGDVGKALESIMRAFGCEVVSIQ
jgi:hypothetical protein